MNRVITVGSSGEFPVAGLKPQRKIKAFILEDQPVALQLYADLLATVPAQFQIHKFTDGDEAWTEMTKSDPDILIMDIAHPGLDGWEILKLLTVERVTYPILVITGDCLVADCYKTFDFGLNLAILSKPFRIQTFYKHLSVMLRECDGFMPSAEQTFELTKTISATPLVQAA